MGRLTAALILIAFLPSPPRIDSWLAEATQDPSLFLTIVKFLKLIMKLKYIIYDPNLLIPFKGNIIR